MANAARVVFVLLAFVAAGCARTAGPNVDIDTVRVEPEAGDTMTVYQLDAELQALASFHIDRSIYTIDGLMETADTPEERMLLTRAKTRLVRALMDIVTGPNPSVAVLDLAVVMTLQQRYIQDLMATGATEWKGVALQPLYDNNAAGAEEVWELVDRLLQPGQRAELRALIEEWHLEHPDEAFRAEVRLHDFARARRLSILSDAETGLLLHELDETTHSINEMRLLAERAMTRFKYTPSVLRWEVMVLVHELLGTEDVSALLDRTDDISTSFRTLSTTIEEMPTEIERQRSEAIEHFAGVYAQARHETIDEAMVRVEAERESLIAALSAEREAAIDQFMDRIRDERQLLIADVRAATGYVVQDEGDKLSGKLLQVGVILILVALVGSLIMRLIYAQLARKLFPESSAAERSRPR